MRTGGHWSEPAARRTLRALLHYGGEATTFDIFQRTMSMAVHQDVYSLRCWLQFVHGYDEEDTHEAVKTIHVRQSHGDDEGPGLTPRVVIYRLRADVKRKAQELLDHQGTTNRPPRERQAAIFDC